MPTRRSTAAPAAWWHSSGEDNCPHCGEPYVYELEFRCVECDGPGCMHCKELHIEGHHVCPSCASAAGAAKRATGSRSRQRGR